MFSSFGELNVAPHGSLENTDRFFYAFDQDFVTNRILMILKSFFCFTVCTEKTAENNRQD